MSLTNVHRWCLMLRLLGFVFVLIICVGMAPWGLLAGAVWLVWWLWGKPEALSRTPGRSERALVSDAGYRLLNAIPLPNAVYCVNCDLITNSPHDDCGVCGSHSVIAVSRMWQLTLAGAPVKAARYKVSVTVDLREIPAGGLSECTKLIGRLAELGGDLKALHIQVDPVPSYAIASEAKIGEAKVEVLKPTARHAAPALQQVRQAS